MLNKKEISRYSRHLLLPEIGLAGQAKIKQAKVLVIGAGGLGCPALQYLAAMGFGEIGIVDFDKVDESNLQRQILYSVEDIGKLKAETAVSRLSKQNPFVKFNTYTVRLDNQNALNIISDYDVVIDGTDNFATRYLVNDACVIMNKPLIYGSIYKFEGQVSVLNYTDSSGKPGPTYRCLFPTPPRPGSVPGCSEIGVLGILPGIIGTFQATEAIKIISGIGNPLSGRLLLFDALAMSFLELKVGRNAEWINHAPKTREEFLNTDYEYFCGNNIPEPSAKSISADELQSIIGNTSEIQLLDVREPFEEPQVNELVDLQIPLGDIPDKTYLISKNKKVIVFCRSGQRSKRAIELLEKNFGHTNLYNLEGGIMAWINIPHPPRKKKEAVHIK
ncbi:MAG: molybdopterin-synthase adenylyltransferase MoeB [Bacteroidetes bacterium]|nr:molybdopterin-synthase adenylyltransferase MoeB [Bacteroidota bacterium]